MDKYKQQAVDFLQRTKSSIDIKFSAFKKHFPDDKEERAVYKITIKRDKRSYSFDFGQSTLGSSKYMVKGSNGYRYFTDMAKATRYAGSRRDVKTNPQYGAPSEYSVLAALTKYDPGLFDNFCSEYGYDTDSRNAYDTYKKVRDEYLHLATLYSPQELELMQEI